MFIKTLVICVKEMESTPAGPQMTPKPGQGINAFWRWNWFTSVPLASHTSVKQPALLSVFRNPSPQCHPKNPPHDGESWERRRRRRPPSSCLWAHVSWTSFPLRSWWTPREDPVGYRCSAELDEEACDPGNTCSRSWWATSTQGDHIIMWSIKVWFTLPWLCVPSCSRHCGVCCQQGWCMLHISCNG